MISKRACQQSILISTALLSMLSCSKASDEQANSRLSSVAQESAGITISLAQYSLPELQSVVFSDNDQQLFSKLAADFQQDALPSTRLPLTSEQSIINHHAHYAAQFVDQYRLLGHADVSIRQGCDKMDYAKQQYLASDDQVLQVRSNYQESQDLEGSSITYVSNYFYQVSEDKVDINQRVEGDIQRQFNGRIMRQALPVKLQKKFNSAARSVLESYAYKQNWLKDTTMPSYFLSLPEDIDTQEVLNVMRLSTGKTQVEQAQWYDIKHFLLSEDGKSCQPDGHSVELMSNDGVLLFQSFQMPGGVSMSFMLQDLKPALALPCDDQ